MPKFDIDDIVYSIIRDTIQECIVKSIDIYKEKQLNIEYSLSVLISKSDTIFKKSEKYIFKTKNQLIKSL